MFLNSASRASLNSSPEASLRATPFHETGRNAEKQVNGCEKQRQPGNPRFLAILFETNPPGQTGDQRKKNRCDSRRQDGNGFRK